MTTVGQSGRDIIVSYKAQTTPGTPVSGSGATQFRANPGGGLKLATGRVYSNEYRKDAQRSRARLGYREVTGTYEADLSVGTFDALLAAILRSSWSSVLTKNASDYTTFAYAANTITAASGSFITDGWKVGDVIQLAGTATAANNGRNIRITGVSTSVLTTAETLTVHAADATGTITRTKKIYNPAAGSLTRAAFTFEEYYEDLDDSKLFDFCRVTGVKFSLQPNQMVKTAISLVGVDMSIPGSAAAPNFTSPTLSTSVGLTANDPTIRLNGADIAVLTALDIDIQLNAKGQPVIGARVSPDVWESACAVAGQFSAIRTSMALESLRLADTAFELQSLLVDNAAEPKNFVNLFLPVVTIGDSDSPPGAEGPVIETGKFDAFAKDATNGYDATTIAIQTSAA